MYHLHQTQLLNASLDTLWAFIAEPRNLNEITPPEMDFEIVSEVPAKMYDGLLIEYRVRLPLLGTTRWVSEIKHIEEGKSFVDEQRYGPYKLWYHYHGLEACAEGVKMIDRVSYVPPFGPLGKLCNALFIARQLRAIFDYRREILAQRFS